MIKLTRIYLVGCNTLAELQVQVGICVALFKACADELLKIGAGVTLEVGAKANIVACFAALITVGPHLFAIRECGEKC